MLHNDALVQDIILCCKGRVVAGHYLMLHDHPSAARRDGVVNLIPISFDVLL
jgi:hypothetical protein